MRLKNVDIIITMIIVAMNVAWTLLSNRPTLIGVILVLPLVFVLPGYTLTEVLFHRRAPDASGGSARSFVPRIRQPLDVSDRLVLSFGLSLAIDILGGLVLNILPVGLNAISWAAFLELLTTMLSLLAVLFRRGASLNRVRPLRLRLKIYEYILFALAIIVVIISVLYSANNAAQQPHPGFTQLWMLPPVQSEKNCAVRLGVHSFEATPVTYRITMTTNGAHGATWSSISLAPQQEWKRSVPITLSTTHQAYVEVQLYRLDKPETVYRKVNLLLHSSGGGNDGKTQQCGTS